MEKKRPPRTLDKEIYNAYATTRGYLIVERSGGWVDFTFTDHDYFLLDEGRMPVGDTARPIRDIAEFLARDRRMGLGNEVPYETAMTNFVNTNLD